MADKKQLARLKKDVAVWNRWREKNPRAVIDLSEANLREANLREANLTRANLHGANLHGANLRVADLSEANLFKTDLIGANLSGANLSKAHLGGAEFSGADLSGANLSKAHLIDVLLSGASFSRTDFSNAYIDGSIFGNSDLTEVIGLEDVVHEGPCSISTDVFTLSKGKIPEVFLKGCGLSDWEVEEVKIYNPDLTNEEIDKILYKIHDLRATQSVQISPLFISYSHTDTQFVEKVGNTLTEKGIRYWRDIHDMKAGRMEKQIDRAIRQNPTVLLILSEHSLASDWVEHEVRTARELEKETGRDVLCPVALDDSWKDSRWPKRVMEQIKEYNILDFSAWEDNRKFDVMFHKLIDGLELFYK